MTNAYYEGLIRRRFKNDTNLTWKGAAYKEWEDEQAGIFYQIIQLNTSNALQNESIQLNHCVHGYSRKCAGKRCSIWSFQQKVGKQNWESLVTIEVDASRRIVQAKGKGNCNLESGYLDVIKPWGEREGLDFLGC